MKFPTPCLILTAAPSEAEALARAGPPQPTASPPAADWQAVPITPDGRFHLARTGVGKVNAAAAAILLTRPPHSYASVLNLGIGGALPPNTPAGALLPIGTIVVGAVSVYADEGVQTPDRFLDISEVGFPLGGKPPPASAFDGPRIFSDASLRSACMAALAAAGLVAIERDIATVSTCSGTDALAIEVAARTGASVEAMEGAAIAHALARLPAPIPRIPFCEIRVVSNTTGDRPKQQWDIRGSLAKLTEVVAALIRSAS